MLILAASTDANNQGIILAWGFVRQEDYEHWSWFLSNLDGALDGLNVQSAVIMSDRQKGLTKAIEETLTLVTC